MRSHVERHRRPVWKCLLCGGLYGCIAGVFGGPIVMLAYMRFLNSMYGATFYGLELLAAPILGAILGVAEGPILLLLWEVRPPRVTLWWLMIAVAGVGLILGLFVYNPLLGLIALAIPVMMAVPMKLARVAGPAVRAKPRWNEVRTADPTADR